MKYRVRHSTVYAYGETVPNCQNEAHLKPRNVAYQKCLSSTLTVSPRPATLVERTDYFGNHVSFFTIEEGHRQLAITAESVVAVAAPAVPLIANSTPWEDTVAALSAYMPINFEARHFTFGSPYVPLSDDLALFARQSFTPGRKLLEAVLDLTHRIFEGFKFDPAATCVNTPPSEVLRLRKGVCQDFAHLEIGCLRSLGLAARYVSGYLLSDPPPGQPKLVGADVSHAWVSIYLPEFGWYDLDPTNDIAPSTRHVTLGWGRDYGDICPIKGVFIGGGQHTMRVSVDVDAV